MPDMKVTWFFKMGDAGWSEILYKYFDDFALALAGAQQLGQVRANLLGRRADVSIKGIRMQSLSSPYPSDPKKVDIFCKIPPLDGMVVDMPWTKIMVGLTTGSKSQRQYLLGGAPDEVNKEVWYRRPFDTDWNGAFKIWADAISANNGWALRVIDKANAPLVRIQGMAASALGNLEITVANHGLATGDLISFYRVKANDACVKGTHRIHVIDTNTFLVLGFNLRRIDFRSGQYRKIRWILRGITKAECQGKRKRKVGRPFDLLHGRAASCKK